LQVWAGSAEGRSWVRQQGRVGGHVIIHPAVSARARPSPAARRLRGPPPTARGCLHTQSLPPTLPEYIDSVTRHAPDMPLPLVTLAMAIELANGLQLLQVRASGAGCSAAPRVARS